jgi:hypothetical protein
MSDPNNLLNYKCPYCETYASSREEILNHTVNAYTYHGKKGFDYPEGTNCNWEDATNVFFDETENYSFIRNHVTICARHTHPIERDP